MVAPIVKRALVDNLCVLVEAGMPRHKVDIMIDTLLCKHIALRKYIAYILAFGEKALSRPVARPDQIHQSHGMLQLLHDRDMWVWASASTMAKLTEQGGITDYLPCLTCAKPTSTTCEVCYGPLCSTCRDEERFVRAMQGSSSCGSCSYPFPSMSELEPSYWTQ